MPKLLDSDLLLAVADDELILGWRDSEWTGVAPFLEEHVALSSIAQNEIGHAPALYELVAERLGRDAEALAFDRRQEEYRSSPLVGLRLMEWARTIARRFLYEMADAVRLIRLRASGDADVAGLAARIEREEAYHRLHADMWVERLLAADEGRWRLEEAVGELWPYALGLLDRGLRAGYVALVARRLPFSLPAADAVERVAHSGELAELLAEMTVVRRLAPAGRW